MKPEQRRMRGLPPIPQCKECNTYLHGSGVMLQCPNCLTLYQPTRAERYAAAKRTSDQLLKELEGE